MVRRTAVVLGTAGLLTLSTVAGMTQAQAASPWNPQIQSVGQIDQQDIPPQPGSEPDTLVEPDIQASPHNPNWAVAVTHDGRYAGGGAVDISYAWTHDGGKTWHHAPVQGITKAAGGVWDRASDPVLAWAPDGSVYLSILPVNLDCQSGVIVVRSTDGGMTFGPAVLAHYSDTCAVSDDKNWLVVDNWPTSPHFGRLYQFWTPFLSSDPDGQNETGSPQAVVWSDDHGQTWSPVTFVSAQDIFTQNSQPMIQPDGAITDAYLNFGQDAGEEGPEGNVGHHGGDVAAAAEAAPTADPPGDNWVARTSHDGGKTWSPEVLITNDVGEGPRGVRCCLPSATVDPVTGRMFTAWDSATPDQVKLSRSSDGQHWSAPVVVSQSDKPGLDRVNVDVTAFSNQVFVSYGTRDTTVQSGRFVQQQVSRSVGGTKFSAPVSLGPLSDLNFAAVARGKFPGDYAGSSVVDGKLYVAWCVSSTPPDPSAQFHQTLFAAVLKP